MSDSDESLGLLSRFLYFTDEDEGQDYSVLRVLAMSYPVSLYFSVVGFREVFPPNITEYVDWWDEVLIEESRLPGDFVHLVMTFVRIGDLVPDEERFEFGSFYESDLEI